MTQEEIVPKAEAAVGEQHMPAYVDPEIAETVSDILLLTPDTPYDEELRRYTMGFREMSLYDMDEDKALIQKYAKGVSDWLNEHGAEVAETIGAVHDPSITERLVPDISSDTLALFKPRQRAPRKAEAISYSTENLIEALRPSQEAQSFVDQILPEGITVGEAIVLFDKDERYRNVIAAASYRLLEQMADEGLLNGEERVRLNNDIKSVNHGDPAVVRGRNRDVVVGMVLDMLSGRFNKDENWQTGLMMGDHERDARGVFRGGHHSGAAYHVIRALTNSREYDHYFGEPYYTEREKFLRSFDEPELKSEIEDPTLKLRSAEEEALNTGIEMRTQAGDVKRLVPDVTSLMLKAGEFQQNPIALKKATRINPATGEHEKGVIVRYLREAASIEDMVYGQAKAHKIKLTLDEHAKIAGQFIAEQGFEFFVPEGRPITVGRSKQSKVVLPSDDLEISRDHCTVTLENDRFVIHDTSQNGTTFKYSGNGISERDAFLRSIETDTLELTHAMKLNDGGWGNFKNNVEEQRAKAAKSRYKRIGRLGVNAIRKATGRQPKSWRT